jgi:hypothetical protein
MKVPSSPRKRYLGGADWCIAALSEGTVETTGRRCVFTIGVFLDGVPDLERLERGFTGFCQRLPVLWGRPARCWCLAPYWRHAAAPDGARPVSIARHALPEGASRADVVRQVESLINAHAGRAGWTVAFDSVRLGGAACVLAFTFDHALFDAAGAEAFIQLFFRHSAGEAGADEYPAPHLAAPAQLERWIGKFKSGQKVNRLMRRLAQGATTWLPLPPDAPRKPFRFRETAFSPEESRRLQERAYAVAGYLMFTPYALATAAAVFRPLFSRAPAPDASFVVSVSTDKQRSGARQPHLFFNDLSFLYFQFPVAAAAERDALAAALREQLVLQAKEQLPAAIEDANLLMRILPARLLWRFLMFFYRNRLASFGFTVLGESGLKAPAVLGCRVLDQIHFPVIPTPPGIGLILSRSGGVTHAVLSYIEGILTEAEADEALALFRAKLLE